MSKEKAAQELIELWAVVRGKTLLAFGSDKVKVQKVLIGSPYCDARLIKVREVQE